MQHYIIHYAEIALKNKNRFWFEQTLQKRIAQRCNEIAPCKVHRLQGRFLIEFAVTPDVELVSDNLLKIFGLANFIPGGFAAPSLEELKKNLGRELERCKFSSFAVRARRAEKNFPVSSQYVNEEIGRFVKELTQTKVDLENPETTIHIELFEDRIFYGFKKIAGPGGLPVGIAGKVMTLLSGGIDSPVAALRMMKRGCESLFLHFHSAPFVTIQSEDKALELSEILAQFQDGGVFLSVPFGEIQRQIIAKTPEAFRVLLYRRMMLRIAEVLAREYKCLGLVTGESLSQVASQTLSNLAAIESVVDMPLFRPLIGMDKIEIIEEAKKFKTFEISIRPHDDCCSFMLPKFPKTNSRIEELDAIEKGLDIDSLVQKGVKEAKSYQLLAIGHQPKD